MSQTATATVREQTGSVDPAAAIELDGLTKRFGEHVAVDKMTFNVPRGSIFGFLGPNGAGKTTTIGMLLGLIPQSSGSARVLGYDTQTQLPEVLQRVGAMVERPAFYPYLSGRMNLWVFATQAGISNSGRIQEVLEIVGMTERADANFGSYSTGMKQRIGIGAALLGEPDVVILDEPTSGLDPAGQREVRSLLRRLADEGHTVFLSSHILAEIQEVCTDVAIIARGRLVSSGPMRDILQGTDQLMIEIDRPEDARRMLLDLPEIESAEMENGWLVVDGDLAQAAEINRRLVEAGFAVSQLRHREARLEEAFLELTGEATGTEQSNG